MELIYNNDSFKLNLYKRNTTIISTSDTEILFILNELRNKGLDYISVYDSFSTDTVLNELSLYDGSDILLKEFNYEFLKEKNIKDLSLSNKALLKIIIELTKNKEVLVFYDILTYLDKKTKDKIINFISINDYIFINITSSEEEYLINDYMIVLNEKMVAIEGETIQVLEQEKILKRLGFNIPFAIDISLQLKSYGLVKKIFDNRKMLVGELWKEIK